MSTRVLPTIALPSGPLPVYRTSATPVAFGDGFYPEESDELPFRWMSRQGRITFSPAPALRFLELWIHSPFHDLSQALTAAPDAWTRPLLHGWNPVSVPVPADADALAFSVNKAFPPAHYPGDPRELAVQMRSPLLHADALRHRHIDGRHENAAQNLREILAGRVSLESTPPKLGIDMQGACNVKPPCVYCAWDSNKALEGDNVDLPFTTETLGEYGPFFDHAAQLVNCSIGEPFMMKNIDALLDVFGDRGQLLEVTTNGQVLTDVNIAKLLGRNIHLYISLDAATPETYAKLRNTQFTRLLDNVRRLVRAKGGRGRLPLVYFVFMPMRANLHEIDAFVRLCAEMDVDRLVLRPLNASETVDLKWDRAGYHFDYQSELLPFPELVRVSGRVEELCRRAGVPLSDQMDFGGELMAQFGAEYAAGRASVAAVPASTPTPVAPAPPASVPPPAAPVAAAVPVDLLPAAPLPSLGQEVLPACTEPWSSLYILRRGVMPCCYGGAPIAKMGAFKEAWNGALMQAIRGELLQGRFHRYCFDSPDCPIVRKSEQARDLSARQESHLVARRWLRRARFGWPGAVYRACKRAVRRVVARRAGVAENDPTT